MKQDQGTPHAAAGCLETFLICSMHERSVFVSSFAGESHMASPISRTTRSHAIPTSSSPLLPRMRCAFGGVYKVRPPGGSPPPSAGAFVGFDLSSNIGNKHSREIVTVCKHRCLPHFTSTGELLSSHVRFLDYAYYCSAANGQAQGGWDGQIC